MQFAAEPRPQPVMAGLTMEQRDSIAAEWSKTVSIIEAPAAAAPKL